MCLIQKVYSEYARMPNKDWISTKLRRRSEKIAKNLHDVAENLQNVVKNLHVVVENLQTNEYGYVTIRYKLKRYET